MKRRLRLRDSTAERLGGFSKVRTIHDFVPTHRLIEFLIIDAANNAQSRFDDGSTLDVHGLRKKEAIICVERKLRELQLAGKQRLKVIVGKGKHSKQGIAVLKPAVLESMQKYVLHKS